MNKVTGKTDNVPLSSMASISFAISKVCRLCGTKDGPFLNIFGPGMDLAKKIEDLLIIMVNESDDLPHKICFRCSAKVADFYEFQVKCMRTQENFSKMLGKSLNRMKREKANTIKCSWEAKLNKNKLSNEEYCDKLVKKALSSISGLKLPETPPELPPYIPKIQYDRLYREALKKKLNIKLVRVDNPKFQGVQKRNGQYFIVNIKKKTVNVSLKNTKRDDSTIVDLKQNEVKKSDESGINVSKPRVSFEMDKFEDMPLRKLKRKLSKEMMNPAVLNVKELKEKEISSGDKSSKNCESSIDDRFQLIEDSLRKLQTQIKTKSTDESKVSVETSITSEGEPNSRLIPDCFTAVRVSGVGLVYTCKTCDHLILERHRIFSHKCAMPRTASKQDNHQSVEQTNCKINKIGKLIDEMSKPQPACKKRKIESDAEMYIKKQIDNIISMKVNQPISILKQTPSNSANPISNAKIQLKMDKSNKPLPKDILMNSFILVPTGNDSYTLQTTPLPKVDTPVLRNTVIVNDSSILPDNSIKPATATVTPPAVPDKSRKRRHIDNISILKKNTELDKQVNDKDKKIKKQHTEKNTPAAPAPPPYPIGLLCRNSGESNNQLLKDLLPNKLTNFVSNAKSEKVEFPMYTILPPKTPGKLVLATIPPAKKEEILQKPILEIPKKRNSRSKISQSSEDKPIAPTTVESPQQIQSSHFFTYVNLDPLLSPSFVLPTSNTSRQPQIASAVSSAKSAQSAPLHAPLSKPTTLAAPAAPIVNKTKHEMKAGKTDAYTCSICDMQFTREKKLLAHVKKHYQGFNDDDDFD